MSKRDELRAVATGLRVKASQGVLAVQAAKDLLVVVPKGLQAAIDAAITEGELEKRWEAELDEARKALANGDTDIEPEARLAAVTAMLAWQQSIASVVISKYIEKIEGDRRAAEGRALGIEEAIKALEEPPPDPAPTA